MKDMNSVNLVGRLTKDIEKHVTSSGFTIGKISLANNTSEKYDGEWSDKPNFFDLILLGKTAESLAQYLVKGKQIAVCGELQQDRWTDKEGKNRSKVTVKVNTIQLLGGKSDAKKQAPKQDVLDDYEDDIPF